jgi:hypothetical protein
VRRESVLSRFFDVIGVENERLIARFEVIFWRCGGVVAPWGELELGGDKRLIGPPAPDAARKKPPNQPRPHGK